jgi:hypothetical protein
MRYKIVTSFSKPLWEKYAEECIKSLLLSSELPEGSSFEFWVQGIFPIGLPMKSAQGLPVKYKSLDAQSPEWLQFANTFGNVPRPEVPPGQEFRFNFMPFSCKVFALAEAAWDMKDYDALVWFDADTFVKEKFDGAWLERNLFPGPSNLAYLDRGPRWGYGETGCIGAKKADVLQPGEVDQVLDVFIEQAKVFGSGQLFFFREWHDAFTFTSIARRASFQDPERVRVNNLNKDMNSEVNGGLEPFETSCLAEKFVHLKGNRKEQIKEYAPKI